MWDKEKLRIKYLRLSMEDHDVSAGDRGESASISSQRLCMDQYIQAHADLGGGFEELIDDGYSGTDFERPGAAQLLKLVEAGRVETIIVRDLSRFARNYLEAGYFLEFVFPARDVRFISVNDNYDSRRLGESTAGLQLAVRNLVNQLYSRDISLKIKSAVDLKKLNGEYIYGTAPYGYRKGAEKNTIVIDEAAAACVRQIFAWAVEGLTISQIAVKLNEAGVMTPSAYLKDVRGKHRARAFWTYESVRNILTNRIYTGDTEPFKSHVVRIGSKRVKQIPEGERLVLPDTHEAIVSRETYYLARRVVKSNVKSKARGPSSPLSTYLVCGCCGNKLQKGRAANKYYRCASARYRPDSPCAGVRMSEERISQVLLRAILNQCAAADARLQAIKVAQKGAAARQEALRGELREQQRIVERRRAEMMEAYEAYVRGTLTKEAFTQQKTAGKAAEEDAKIQVKLLSARLEELSASARTAQTAAKEAVPLAGHGRIEALSPQLLRELVREITVYPHEVIHIAWNFHDFMSAGEGLEAPQRGDKNVLSHIDNTHVRLTNPTGR